MSAVNLMPAELWQRIFSSAAEDKDSNSFIDLWISGRQVCRVWRVQIAQAYLATFIRNPSRCYITFDCGSDYIENIGKCLLGVHMVFDRLDPNENSVCVFKESEKTGGKLPNSWGKEARAEYRASKYGTWAEQLEIYVNKDLSVPDWDSDSLSDDDGSSEEEDYHDHGQGKAATSDTGDSASDEWIDEDSDEDEPMNFDQPAHVLYIYGSANDTELPRLNVDTEKVEISFDWESMLTAFISERAEIDRRNSLLIEKLLRKMRRPLESLKSPGELEEIIANSGVSNNPFSKIRRNIRRYRIKKAIKERGDIEFRDGTLKFTNADFDTEAEEHQLQRIEMTEEGGELGSDDEDEDEDFDDGEDDDTDDE